MYINRAYFCDYSFPNFTLQNTFNIFHISEELVRLNLRIKTTTVSFVNGDCTTHRQMEQLNSDIRNYLEKMRRTLERLRHLAERQSSSESRKMLLSDVDKYADQLAACHRSFRQANLRYCYANTIITGAKWI